MTAALKPAPRAASKVLARREALRTSQFNRDALAVLAAARGLEEMLGKFDEDYEDVDVADILDDAGVPQPTADESEDWHVANFMNTVGDAISDARGLLWVVRQFTLTFENEVIEDPPTEEQLAKRLAALEAEEQDGDAEPTAVVAAEGGGR